MSKSGTLAVLLAFAALIVALNNYSSTTSRSSSESTLSQIQHSKVLKVGCVIYPPCIIKNSTTGQLEGHFIDTIREIAHQAGWEVQFEESDWATFTAGLMAKRYDVSIAPTFVTIPRATAVAFTRPLFYAGNSAIVRKGDTRFNSISDLDKPGVKIAVTQGEAGHEYAKAHFTNAELIVHAGSDQMLTFQDVVENRADIALGDAYMAAKFAAENNTVKDLFANDPYNLTPVSWAVRYNDPDLLEFLNSALNALESQGVLLQFEQKAGAHWLHPKKDWNTQ